MKYNKSKPTPDDIYFRLGVSEEESVPPSLEFAINNYPELIWDLLNRSEAIAKAEDYYEGMSYTDFLIATGKRSPSIGWSIMRKHPGVKYSVRVKQ